MKTIKKYIIVFAVFILASINIYTESIAQFNNSDILAVVDKNSIITIDISNNQKYTIDTKGKFKYPKINPNGKALAYTKNNELYISDMCGQNIVQVDSQYKAKSYDWLNENVIIYSGNGGGIKSFNIKNGQIDTFADIEFVYDNLNCDSKGYIYAEKQIYYSQADIDNLGIVQYSPSTRNENMILEKCDVSEQYPNGMIPKISKITDDGRYIYIWCTYNMASMSADGVQLGVYDLKKEKFIIFDDTVMYCLYQSNPISINPTDSSRAIVNIGSGRDLNVNKSIAVVDAMRDDYYLILPEDKISVDSQNLYSTQAKGIVTMNPAYSPDSKSVIYSASNSMEVTSLNYDDWFKKPHPIYVMEIASKEIKRITFSDNAFDFAPQYMSDGKDIIFFRTYGSENKHSLFKIRGTNETLLVDNIDINGFDTESVLDIYRKTINRTNA